MSSVFRVDSFADLKSLVCKDWEKDVLREKLARVSHMIEEDRFLDDAVISLRALLERSLRRICRKHNIPYPGRDYTLGEILQSLFIKPANTINICISRNKVTRLEQLIRLANRIIHSRGISESDVDIASERQAWEMFNIIREIVDVA